MIFLLLLQAATLPALPVDWSALAALPYRTAPQARPEYATYVAGEVAAGRFKVVPGSDGRYSVTVEVATLMMADGTVRRAVPRAIGCATVEQYAAGLVTGFARGNVSPRASATTAWYRATVVFDWR